MKKIAITGSSGFIGLKLSEFLKKKNFEIINLQRIKTDNSNVLRWELGKNLPEEAMSADIFIHCAHDNSINSLKKDIADNVNYLGTQKLVKQIRKKKSYKIYYLSSQSSNEYSKSYYGKLKFNIEKLFDSKYQNKEIIIRPGIVYSKEKSYITELIKSLSKFKIFPFFSFKKNVQPIDIDDLLECIYRIITKDKNLNIYNLGTEYKINIRDYIKFICRENKLPVPFFIYIPHFLSIIIATIVDLLKITKFSLTERINGLVFLQELNSKKDLQSINYKLRKDFL
jgi:nucleoside-diphosphate-sugar epimerase